MFTKLISFDYKAQIFELRGLGTYLIKLINGRLKVYLSDNNNSLNTCSWLDRGQLVLDNDVLDFNIQVLDGNNLVLVYSTARGISKVAIWPGDFPLYGNNDPYRFYYGIDSETLYMNVENRWVPVSYLSHDKMRDIGTMSHDQLENAIVGALERISNLEEAPPGSSEINFVEKEW